MSVSVLILTKNEEKDLPGCLSSLSWCDDVHLYDSMSDDGTVELARKFGAKITSRQFDNWAAHQNWGLKNIKFKYNWVFYIDADERMTPDLISAVKTAVESSGDNVAFSVQRRDFFLGTWLKHVQASPYYLRLFRPEFMRYERLVNPISIPDGPTGVIGGYLDHYPFSKGLSHWVARHNSYSSLEASQIINNRTGERKISLYSAVFSRDFHERRFHQKELFYLLPFRPVIKFIILYFLKGGFLDGRAGFVYSVLQAFYEYMIVLKVREAQQSIP